MQRKFILNLILIIAVNLLIKPLYIFGVEINVQNTIGAENYGMYYALFNLSFILSFILDPGITNYNNRHISQNQHLLDKSFSNITITKILLSGIYMLFILAYGVISALNTTEWTLILLLLLGQIFNSFTLYNRSNIAGLQFFKTDTFLSITDKLLMILLCLPLLIFEGMKVYMNVTMFVMLQTISFAISAAISFFIVKSKTSNFAPKFNLNNIIVILKESYPYALLTLLMLIYSKIDTVLLKELHINGNKEVGYYAAAYRIIDALNMIAVLFAGLLYPIFSKSIKSSIDVAKLIKTSFSILVLPAMIVAIVSIIYSRDIMQLLYNENIEYSSSLFQNLLVSFIFICNSYIFGTYLTAKGEIKLLNIFALVAAILNILLNILFIPIYGASAACLITIFTFGLVSVLQVAYSLKSLNIKISFIKGLSFSLWLITSIVINITLKTYISNWFLAIIIGSSLSILILFIVRLISVKQALMIINNKQ
jgi:O-antigen/teichoic acid export membrane protein